MINIERPSTNGYRATNIFGGMQIAEMAGRNCYKSEGNSSPGSYKKFLTMLINKGHTSILEHCPLYFETSDNILGSNQGEIADKLKKVLFSPFSRYKHIKDKCKYRIYTNLRVVYNVDSEFALKLIESTPPTIDAILAEYGLEWFEPDVKDEYNRYTCHITTLRSVVDELVRERIASEAVESTRWCDYTKGKFNGITFCIPHWLNPSIFDRCFKKVKDNYDLVKGENDDLITKLNTFIKVVEVEYNLDSFNEYKKCYGYLLFNLNESLCYYRAKKELGLPAEDAREFLPLGIKSDIVYTNYLSDWKTIFEKRLNDKYGKAHPNMHIIMQQCKDHLDCFMDSEPINLDKPKNE